MIARCTARIRGLAPAVARHDARPQKPGANHIFNRERGVAPGRAHGTAGPRVAGSPHRAGPGGQDGNKPRRVCAEAAD